MRRSFDRAQRMKSAMTVAQVKHSIRIVTRKERELIAEQAAAPSNHLKTENQSKREWVGTIDSWIEERRETMKAFSGIVRSATKM